MSTTPSTPDPRIGTKIAERYELERLIGKGGMGVVYRGRHVATHRAVAVKLLRSDADEAAARRFMREARIAAKVSHPNLVDVIDVGKTEDGGLFLVLELLEGEALSEHLRRKGPMRAEDALDTVVPIIDALAALHAAGVVHRDIKPSNIFLSLDGTSRVVPKLLDLGVSKPLDPKEAMTETGMMLGTPHYMSPEQATGSVEVGVAADIWAMGVVLFETLTGDRPFNADTIPGLLYKIATGRPPRLGERMPKLPPAISAAIDRALAYEPSSRHASASELAEALVEGALEAGWALTCRMPSGPRISLAPFAPSLPSADELTPMLGGDPVTPMMSAGTPRPIPVKPPGVEPITPIDRTRDVPSALVASLAGRELIASADTQLVPGTRMTPANELREAESSPLVTPAPRESAPVQAAPAPRASIDPAPSQPAIDPTPSENVRQLSSRPLKYALPALGLLAAAAIGAWITSLVSGGEHTSERSDPEPIVVPSAAAAPSLPDAGAAIAAPAAPAVDVSAGSEIVGAPTIVPVAAPPRRRPRPQAAHVDPPPPPPVQPAPRRDPPRVEVGTNGAPIIGN